MTAPLQGPAPREFPGACPRGGDVDQAYLAGIPAPRTHGQADGADVSVRLCPSILAPRGNRGTGAPVHLLQHQ